MARGDLKHPTVFVGCPYLPAKGYAEFRKTLDLVPIQFVYAESNIKTRHILERIRGHIAEADYSLFDITGWNPNVALELGLAAGLGRNYFILFRPGRRKQADAPADLKGIQRFQFKRLRGFAPDCLEFQLNEHLVRKLPHPRYVFDRLAATDRARHFLLAMRVLAHFKRATFMTRAELDRLVAGTRLRRPGIELVLELLVRRKLLKPSKDKARWTAGRDLYPRLES